MELIGLGVAFLVALMALDAHRSNRKADESWERMHRELTPTHYLARPNSTDIWGGTFRAFHGNSMRPDWIMSGDWKPSDVSKLRSALRRHFSGESNRSPLILGDSSAYIHTIQR